MVSLMSLSARRRSSCNLASVHHLLGEIEICCPDPNFLELPASDPEVIFSPRALVLEVGGAYRPSTPAKNRFGLHVGSLRALFLLTFTRLPRKRDYRKVTSQHVQNGLANPLHSWTKRSRGSLIRRSHASIFPSSYS